MPNHIINELIFRGVTPERQAVILEKLCNADGKVDFDILVPTPPNVWLGDVSQEWSKVHWGTKWNAYGHKPIVRTDNTLTLRFDTAWSPPSPWLVAIFNVLKCDFEHNWLDEGAARGWHSTWNHAALSDSKVFHEPWKEQPCDDDMQRHLHKLRWGVESFDDDDAA